MEPTSTPTSTLTVSKPVSPEFAKELANKLTDFLKTNNLLVNIAGKNYVPVEGWQFTGAGAGLTQIIISCERVAPFDVGDTETDEIKYKAVAEIVNEQGTVVSRGFAWCSNKEAKKKSFDEYAIASMAQTRAIGKAYRNILSWIVKMAGYEATPAEEVDDDKMEADLTRAKQRVLKTLNAHDITAGNDVMEYIEKVIGKRVIETIDEAEQIIRSFDNG